MSDCSCDHELSGEHLMLCPEYWHVKATQYALENDRLRAELAAAQKRLREVREVWARDIIMAEDSHAAMFRQENEEGRLP